MRKRTAVRVDDSGNIVIPDEFRRRHGLDRDAKIVVESREDGLFLRPASKLSRHTYSAERRAEFLLTNASDDADYRRAVQSVRAMGLEPKDVPHDRPGANAKGTVLA